MKYKKLIDPELRRLAIRIPFNKAIIKFANIFQMVSFFLTGIPRGVKNRNFTVKGYRGRKFRVDIMEPSDRREKLPCLIYVHGGAFSYKASAHHKRLACIYAGKAGCRVFFPDYHLAPKHPWPAAYHDVLALYRYLLKNPEKLGIDSGRIGFGGDSAGASIAALLCNNYEKEGLKPPCFQMLVYPLTCADMDTASMKRFTDTPLWNSKNNRRMWLYYCGSRKPEDTRDASPMHSDLPQIIPDTYIETAEYDCLHDEGVAYGRKLQEAGAKVEINETEGTFHGYDAVLNAEVSIRNIKKRILFLKRKFYGGSPE